VTAPKPWRRRVSRSGAVPLCFVTDAPQLAAGSFTSFAMTISYIGIWVKFNRKSFFMGPRLLEKERGYLVVSDILSPAIVEFWMI
jgi:hypothetical protein